MWNTQGKYFGLDIGDRSLKALTLRFQGPEARLDSWTILPLPAGLIQAGKILDPAGFARLLKKTLQEARILTSHAIVGLPETKTYLKLLDIKAHASSLLHAQVSAALEKQIPFKINDVIWDFSVIQQYPTHTLTLAAAAQKTLVASYTALIEKAGLIPDALDLEPLAIARALMKHDSQGGCTMLADIGATKTTLILATPQTVVATADTKSEGERLTAQLAQGLKIETNSAEEMKLKYGVPEGPKEYRAILETYVDHLASAIKKFTALTLAQEQFCPAVIEVLLTGGGAMLAGLPAALQQRLHLPVRLANPWVNIRVPSSPLPLSVSIRLATACGLALHQNSQNHGA